MADVAAFLPAREEARAVHARRNADLAVDRANLLRTAAVGPVLVHRDLAAYELLVDRFGRLLDVVLRHRVLRGRRLALTHRGADREGQLDRVDDAVEEQLA